LTKTKEAIKTPSTESQQPVRVNKKKRKPKPHPQFRTETFIGIDDIREGVIVMSNKRYLKILEVIPTNFFNKTAVQMDSIVYYFAEYLRNSPKKLQIKIMSVPTNMSGYIQRLQGFKNCRNANAATRLTIDELSRLIIDTTTNRKITNSRYFLIYEYEEFKLNPQFQDVKNWLDWHEYRAMEAFEKCECGIVNHFLAGGTYDNISMAEYILLHFDRSAPKYLDVRDALVKELLKKNPKKVNSIMPNDVISPREVAFYDKSFYELNGKYYTTFYISDYRAHVLAGWLNPIILSFNGVDVDIHIVQENSNVAKKKVRSAISKQELTLNEISDNTSLAQEAKVKYQDAKRIQDQQTNEGEQLNYMSVLISISADTLEELDKKVKDVKDLMEIKDLPLAPLTHRQEEGFTSSLPFNNLDEAIAKMSQRNVMAKNIASVFPFNEPALFEPDGVFIGTNIAGKLCAFNSFNTEKYENPHMMMLGSSGYGKTFAGQIYLGRKRLEGARCFVIAPIKGYEYEKLCNNLGGQYVKFSPDGDYHINIFDIRVPDSDVTVEGNVFRGSYLAEHLGIVKTYFSILMPLLTPLQYALLDTAIVKAYEEKGITKDNNSLYESPGVYKKFPIIQDICIALNNMKLLKVEDFKTYSPDITTFHDKIDELVGIMQEFVVGTNSFLNKETNIKDIHNDYTVYDVTELDNSGQNVLGAVMYTVVIRIMTGCKEDIHQQKVALIDEVWKLIGDGSKLSASFIKGMYKVFRAYNAQVITASQDIEDWKAADSESVLNTIINNSMFQMILCSKPKSLEILRDELALNKEQADIIRRARRGDILFLCKGNSFQLRFDATETEFKAVNTDLNIRKRMEQQEAIMKADTEWSAGMA